MCRMLLRAVAVIAGIVGVALIGADWIIFPALGLGQSWWRLAGLGAGFILIVLAIRLERHLKQLGIDARHLNNADKRGNGAAI